MFKNINEKDCNMFTFFSWRKIFFRLKNEKGSVAIEFVFYFFAICLLCILLIDFSRFLLNKACLERVNNTLASILRERSALYQGKDVLTQKDVNQLDRLASTLLAETRIGERYQLYVDAVYFKESSRSEKIIKGKPDEFTGNNRSGGKCTKSTFAKDLNKLIALSPFSHADNESISQGHWLPVYQVTICAESDHSLFMKTFESIGLPFENISVSNAVIPR